MREINNLNLNSVDAYAANKTGIGRNKGSANPSINTTDSFKPAKEEVDLPSPKNIMKQAGSSLMNACNYMSRGTSDNTAVVLSKLANIPFPTIVDPMSAEEREKVSSLIQPGDILIQKDENSPIMQTISKVGTGSDFIHAAIYKGDGKILESVPRGVREADLNIYLKGYSSVMIFRPPYKTPEDKQAAIAFAEKQVGKPYNKFFNDDGGKSFYCTQLVRDALASTPNPINVPVANYMGKNVIGTHQLESIEGGETVYSSNRDFKQSMDDIIKGTHSAAIWAAYFTIPCMCSTIASHWMTQSIL